MLWTLLLLVFLLWLLGIITHVGGTLVHLLLVFAVFLFLIELLSRRRVVQ